MTSSRFEPFAFAWTAQLTTGLSGQMIIIKLDDSMGSMTGNVGARELDSTGRVINRSAARSPGVGIQWAEFKQLTAANERPPTKVVV